MSFILALLQLFPQILAAILAVEQAFKQPVLPAPVTTFPVAPTPADAPAPEPAPTVKLGPLKKQLIMDTISSGTLDTKVLSAASTMIDRNAAALKSAGVI